MQNQIVRYGFFFLGGHPALDFINTKPVQKGQTQDLLTSFSMLLRWFVAARLIEKSAAAQLASRSSDTPQSDAALTRILSFRESMRSAIISLESKKNFSQGTIDEVNDLLKQ